MTEKQRQTYNTGPFQVECEFDTEGTPHKDRCNDFRLQNHKQHAPSWTDMRLATGQGFFVRPSKPGPMPEDITIPDDVSITWYNRVSKTEVACFQLMKRTNPRPEFYPTACYDPIFKEIHVTYGDWAALKHELLHHTVGNWHD